MLLPTPALSISHWNPLNLHTETYDPLMDLHTCGDSGVPGGSPASVASSLSWTCRIKCGKVRQTSAADQQIAIWQIDMK
jgi:hypothetical protein